MKHTYTIKFKKLKIDRQFIDNGWNSTWKEVDTSDLVRAITNFCILNKINLKHIKIEDTYSNSYIKVKCCKENYIKLLLELNEDKYGIELNDIKY